MFPMWEDAMATGVEEIDDDHRRIADLFDDALISLGRNPGHAAIVDVLSRLVDSMCEHIERENELMRSIRDRTEAQHRLEHDEYLSRLSQLMVDCQKHDSCIVSRVRDLASLWKHQHQERFDRPLAQSIRRQREPARL